MLLTNIIPLPGENAGALLRSRNFSAPQFSFASSYPRDLSWLSQSAGSGEAQDATQPLLERCKICFFLSIFSSNLDEVFRNRVAGNQTADRKLDQDEGRTD